MSDQNKREDEEELKDQEVEGHGNIHGALRSDEDEQTEDEVEGHALTNHGK